MTIDKDVQVIRREVENLKDGQRTIYHSLPGWGLYTIAIVGTLAAIDSCSNTSDIQKQIQATPQIQTQNTIGQEMPEKFYDINGQRVYLEIDGKPVEQYFKK